MSRLSYFIERVTEEDYARSKAVDKKKPAPKKKVETKKPEAKKTSGRKGNSTFGHANSKEWWDSLTFEKQTEWIKLHPQGDVAQKVNSGEWQMKGKEGEKGKEDKSVPPKPGKPGRNAKGDPDFTGTGIPPEKGHMTPEQLKNAEKEEAKMKKDQELAAKKMEKEKVEAHQRDLHSKFGRLKASPEEIEMLDKERDEKEKAEKKAEEKKQGIKTEKPKPGTRKGPKYETKIAGKDKSLNDNIDTSKQKAFTTKLYDEKKGDKAFTEKAKDYNGRDLTYDTQWSPPSWLTTSGKVPVREAQIFSRMMNTKLVSSTEPPISFFTDGGPGGAGKLQAQAGELMTMMFTSMSEKEMNEFEKSVKDHLAATGDKNGIITKDWLKAGKNNATAVHRRMEKEFGVDDASKIITHTCWDTKDDVEALGLSDYNKNKGFSSDIYVKVKLPNGQTILNEVSLKKDKNVNFLNSSTGKFKTWDKNLSPDVDPVVFATTQKRKLTSNVNKDMINRLLATSNTPKVKELKDLMAKNKETTIDKFMSGSNRSSRKVLLTALEVMAEAGDKKAQETYKAINKDSHNYALNAVKVVSSNEKIKKGMLDEVKSEFPLKAVTENEETMAIGDMSVDKSVIGKIFGTDKWEEIQEHLDAITDKDPPYLAYKAKGSKEVIPIAVIAIREDGVGYGSQFKFEMKLDSRFASLLKKTNDRLYSKETIKESVLYRWMIYSDYVGED